MMPEKFRWLAGVIAAHPGREVVGRMRLQATILLLQQLNLPTDYCFRTFFNGPYSEGLHADVRLLESFGFISETRTNCEGDGPFWYVLTASADSALADIEPFQRFIDALQFADSDILEVAATYAALRAQGDDHDVALWRTRCKKGKKCDGGKDEAALDLLKKLGLPSAPREELARKVS